MSRHSFIEICPIIFVATTGYHHIHCKDCEDARKRYQSQYKKAHRQGCPTPEDLKKLRELNRTLKNSIILAKRTKFQEYVSEVETLPAMAKLSKILKSRPSNKLGLVRKPDGLLSTSPEESLETMVGEHFPGSIVTDTPTVPLQRGNEVLVDPVSWITTDRTWAAIISFGPHKACGPDKLKPVALFATPSSGSGRGPEQHIHCSHSTGICTSKMENLR
jgi:hypothetical protein